MMKVCACGYTSLALAHSCTIDVSDIQNCDHIHANSSLTCAHQFVNIHTVQSIFVSALFMPSTKYNYNKMCFRSQTLQNNTTHTHTFNFTCQSRPVQTSRQCIFIHKNVL